jgi:lysozyme family protein
LRGERPVEDGFATCLAFTLKAEGGFVDNPNDPGGATNMGITLATYRTWVGDPAAPVSAIQTLSQTVASAIYRGNYWNPLRADGLPAGVDLCVFDFGVNTGIWRSGRILQQALGFAADQIDGSIGPITLAAAGKADPATLVNSLADRQETFYRSLSTFADFGRGWLNCTDARRAAALAMLV